MAMRTERGVTLVELVVTVLVLAILGAVAAPSFVDYIAQSKLKGAADEVVSQLVLARAEAVRLDRDVAVRVVADTSTGVWCVGSRQWSGSGTMGLTLVTGNAATCDCSASEGAGCVVAGTRSVVSSSAHDEVAIVGGEATQIYFDRKVGTIVPLTQAANTRTVVMESERRPDRYRVNIVVSPMGHARVCTPAGYAIFGGYDQCS